MCREEKGSILDVEEFDRMASSKKQILASMKMAFMERSAHISRKQ